MTLTVGSLFSGIGGFDAAFEAVGAEVLWQVETDPTCNRILERHWPNARRYGDVTAQGVATLAPVDLICGGFPCQDVSIAGGREGLAGERSGLWHEFARILAELRPRYVVIENVPGLLSSNEGRDMGTILWTLGDMGYGWAYRILDAQWAGLAQRRDRVFIVGCLGDWTGATQILLEPEGGIGDSAPRREAGARLAAAVAAGADRPGLKRYDDLALPLTAHAHRDGDMDTNYVVARPLKGGGNDRQDASHETYILQATTHTLTSKGAEASEDGTGRGVPMVVDTTQITSKGNYSNPKPGDPSHPLAAGMHPPTLVAPPLVRMREGKPGGGKGPLLSEGLSLTLAGGNGQTLETQDDLAYALTNPGNGGRTQERQLYDGMAVRRLTPLECERLQGFPDGHTAHDAAGKAISDSARYRMLGNAVAPPVAQWIAERIVEAVEKEAQDA